MKNLPASTTNEKKLPVSTTNKQAGSTNLELMEPKAEADSFIQKGKEKYEDTSQKTLLNVRKTEHLEADKDIDDKPVKQDTKTKGNNFCLYPECHRLAVIACAPCGHSVYCMECFSNHNIKLLGLTCITANCSSVVEDVLKPLATNKPKKPDPICSVQNCTNPAIVVNVPCGHFTYCNDCNIRIKAMDKTSHCPMCNQQIRSQVTWYADLDSTLLN